MHSITTLVDSDGSPSTLFFGPSLDLSDLSNRLIDHVQPPRDQSQLLLRLLTTSR